MRWLCRLTLAAAVACVSPVVSGGSSPQSVVAPDAAQFDALITATLRDWKVPGVAVAIVRGDQVYLAKGYGYRDMERQKPVTHRTLFRIASMTKSFTAAGVAALVSQGKLQWTTPVREYLPEFRLYTENLTARVTPLDLLTHRTGLLGNDGIWYYNRDLSREELIRRLRFIEPNKDLRETFQYNNLMYLAAGYLGGRLLNTSWEEATRKLIFEPLSMTASDFRVEAMEASDDYAAPYSKDKDGKAQRVPQFNGNGVAPAGMINSNAEEMGRYVLMLLDGGRFEGKQVLSKADVQEMTRPQMVFSRSSNPRYPELSGSDYGLGLLISSYRGHRLVFHDGGVDGYTSKMAFLPTEQIGVVVLSNLFGSNYASALTYEIFDRLLGVPPRNWSQSYLEDERLNEAAEKKEPANSSDHDRKSGAPPSHPLPDYVGYYEHPAYGLVRIEQPGKALSLSYGYLHTALVHSHYDTFEFATQASFQDELPLLFASDMDGEIASLAIPLEPLLGKPIVFQRVADPQMRTREFLSQFTGAYELGSLVWDVVLQGEGQNSALQLRTQGPVFDLEPLRGTTFRIKQLAVSSLEFQKDRDGAVTGAVMHQPDGNSALKRKL